MWTAHHFGWTQRAMRNGVTIGHILMDAIHQAWHQSAHTEPPNIKQNRNFFYTVSAQLIYAYFYQALSIIYGDTVTSSA
jgi:hypothetical protein